MAVMGMAYTSGGEPSGCASVMVSVIVMGGVTLALDNFSVRLGEGLLAVTVMTLLKAALFSKRS